MVRQISQYFNQQLFIDSPIARQLWGLSVSHCIVHSDTHAYTHTHTAFCTGDPHLTNLDGAKFTFNGWGEYILLELETANTTFWVQARMQPIVGSLATELTAFAFAMSRDTPVEVCEGN